MLAGWEELVNKFNALPNPPCGRAVVMRRFDNPGAFVSFTPWASREHVDLMHEQRHVVEHAEGLKTLCKSDAAAYEVFKYAGGDAQMSAM
jgi:hypothetical protein